MLPQAVRHQFRLEAVPRIVLWSTALLLLAGVAAFNAWWRTGNPLWIRAYFYYPGALFFLGSSALAGWCAYLCWREFAPGDLLRPAWFLIVLSALSQLAGGLVSQVLGNESHLNPLLYLPAGRREAAIRMALELGRIFGPLYLAFLAWGLFYVVRACRRNGILGSLKLIDCVLLGIVVVFTAYYVSTVAFAGRSQGHALPLVDWISDPLLCVLLFEVILIRRSTANMGWGLISRCWMSFTVAVFLTSVGDIGLWAAANGHLPYSLEAASWYVWFIASAAYALGPVYQLQAFRRATGAHLPAAEMQPQDGEKSLAHG